MLDGIRDVLFDPLYLIIFLALTLILLIVWAKPILESIDAKYENNFEPNYHKLEVKEDNKYLKTKPIIKPPKTI